MAPTPSVKLRIEVHGDVEDFDIPLDLTHHPSFRTGGNDVIRGHRLPRRSDLPYLAGFYCAKLQEAKRVGASAKPLEIKAATLDEAHRMILAALAAQN